MSMSRLLRTALAGLLGVALLLTPATRAAEPTLRLQLPAQAQDVATDGTFVVWKEIRASSPHYSIHGARISDGQPLLIKAFADSARIAGRLRIDQGRVVWVREQDATAVLEGRDLIANTDFEVATASFIWTNIDIAADRVVWFEGTSTPTISVLKLRDLRTLAPARTLAQMQPLLNGGPVIDGNRVAWGEGALQGDWRLMLLQLDEPAPRVVAERAIGDDVFWLELRGDLLLYVRGSGFARGGRFSVNLLDLRRGSTLTIDPAGSSVSDGRYVVYSAWDPSQAASRLFGYDAQTDSFFALPILGDPRPLAIRQGMLFALQQQPGQPQELLGFAMRHLRPTAPVPRRGTGDQIYFNPTGHHLGGAFKHFWESSGGLAVFGYPLTEELRQRNADTGQYYQVQYLERQRYEQHPEHQGTVYEVLLGRLGVEVLQRQGRDWQSFPKASPAAPHYFPETGHAIAPQFWGYWSSHGLAFDGQAGTSFAESLALFGYPISQPQLETNSSGDRVLTQWFERARFEYHPNNPEPYQVLLGRLGDELIADAWR